MGFYGFYRTKVVYQWYTKVVYFQKSTAISCKEEMRSFLSKVVALSELIEKIIALLSSSLNSHVCVSLLRLKSLLLDIRGLTSSTCCLSEYSQVQANAACSSDGGVASPAVSEQPMDANSVDCQRGPDSVPCTGDAH